MVESDVEALVKEERCRRRFWQQFPLQSSSDGRLQTLYFMVSYLCLRPSRNKIPGAIYRWFQVKTKMLDMFP
jgi:hypothetical protein